MREAVKQALRARASGTEQRLPVRQLTGVTQKPFVHGVVPQHCEDVVHCCPYCEHEVPPVGVVVVPASVPAGGGGAAAPHVPLVAPGATVHGEPEQQSAVVVQVAPDG
jgi:hypothetical protein